MPKKANPLAADAASRLTWLPTTLSQAELAEMFGISTRVVRDYVTRGIIVSSPQPGRYLARQSIAAYLASLRGAAQGRASTEGPSLADERAKTETVNRKIAEIKLAQMQGEVLTLDEVAEQWSALALQLRTAVLGIPTKARSTIPHLTPHDGETLRTLVREVLANLAEEIEMGVVGADPKVLTDA